MTMRIGFREAYGFLRGRFIYQCHKHELYDDPEVYADEKINQMTLAELLSELESIASELDEQLEE